MSTIPQKRCPRCKKILPLDLFGNNSRLPSGKANECKQCAIERQAEYRKSPERVRSLRNNGKSTVILLTQHKATFVDEEDSDLALHKWRFSHGYAIRHKSGARHGEPSLRMHRVILERMLNRKLLPEEEVDHVDGDRLNNRRSNLRLATRQQNAHNMSKKSYNTSGYKGASFEINMQLWQAVITYNGKHFFLGYYATPEEAAKAYNDAAITYFGEFARLNDIPPNIEPHRIKSVIRNTNTSGYRGVSLKKQSNKWGASINHEGKRIYLGYYDTPLEAAQAYNEAAIRLKGDHALLNVLE